MNKIIIAGLSAFLISTSAHALDGRAQAHCYNNKSSPGHLSRINSFHQAKFINDTNQTQNFKVTYRICAQFHPCQEHIFKLKCNPHDTWQDTIPLHMQVKYHHAGKYKTSAETVIEGPIFRREFSQAKIEVVD